MGYHSPTGSRQRLTMGPLALVIFSVIFQQSWADPVYTKFPILPLDESGQGNKARVAYDLWREVGTKSFKQCAD